MYVLSWLDNRTLIACDLMLAVAFAIIFFALMRAYPDLRGINSVAISFLLWVPGILLTFSRGAIRYSLSVIALNCFLLGSFVFLYRGILRFIGSNKSASVAVAISLVSLSILYYYSQIDDKIVPRMVTTTLTVGLLLGLIALEIFHKASSCSSPKAMRLFAATMLFFAGATVICGVTAILDGASLSELLEGNAAGSATLLLSVVSLFVTGLFILFLSSHGLIAASRDESQKDSLSGAFNRRGIEAKLAAELKLQNGKDKLSVALIDIDHFKSINDIQGHAAGDAALRDVAETISTHLRGRDFLGRYGGDEFLVILPQTPCGVALGVTERLSKALSNLSVSTGSMPLTLSVGLTQAVLEDDAVTLIARADKGLYQAKSDGRNCRRIVIAAGEPKNAEGAPVNAAVAAASS
jgi:diguanylate cyclase (GGDEF)-like protein